MSRVLRFKTEGPLRGSLTESAGGYDKLEHKLTSRSLDLASAYQNAKDAQDKATEASTANYAKKKSMITEVKQFKEQREEIKMWEKMQSEKVGLQRCGLSDNNQDNLIKRHLLWRLYHLTQEINSHAEEIETANVQLTDLRDQVVSVKSAFDS